MEVPYRTRLRDEFAIHAPPPNAEWLEREVQNNGGNRAAAYAKWVFMYAEEALKASQKENINAISETGGYDGSDSIG